MLVSQFLDTLIKLVATPKTELIDNQNVEYAAGLWRDGLLVGNEEMFEIIISNTDEKLNSLEGFLLSFILATALLGLLIIGYMAHYLVRSNKRRSLFIEILARLDSDILDRNLGLVSNIKAYIDDMANAQSL